MIELVKMIEAKIICDSITKRGNRLTTFVLTFPRIILAEFNTHRALSRNSASSRAIPFQKMMKMAKEKPFIPIKWMKDHKGMQGSDYLEDSEDKLKNKWLEARDHAIEKAKELNELGLTKQLCNRILEPYLWHTAIVTGTEWENFFSLRAEENAEIHIQELAYRMLEVYKNSTPKLLQSGDWHIPFGDLFDTQRLLDLSLLSSLSLSSLKLKIATARCARVSYLNFDGQDNYNSDLELHDRLVQSGHWSPFEHCAQVMSDEEYNQSIKQELSTDKHPLIHLGFSGNFRGFVQYRKLFSNENRSDPRLS